MTGMTIPKCIKRVRSWEKAKKTPRVLCWVCSSCFPDHLVEGSGRISCILEDIPTNCLLEHMKTSEFLLNNHSRIEVFGIFPGITANADLILFFMSHVLELQKLAKIGENPTKLGKFAACLSPTDLVGIQ